MADVLRLSKIQRFLVLGALLTGLGRVLHAAPSPELRERVDALIEQLADPEQNVRNAADAQLHSLPGDALDLIESAAKRDDLGPERTTRLTRALTYLRPRAFYEGRRNRRQTWESAIFFSAYDKGGHANSRDVAQVRLGISAYLKLINTPDDERNPLRPATMAALQRAIDGGCDDPLIQTLCWLAKDSDEENVNRSRAGTPGTPLERCMSGNYPQVVKLWIEMGRLKIIQTWDPVEWDRAKGIFAQLANDSSLPAGEIEALADEYYMGAAGSAHHSDEVMPSFLDNYAKAFPNAAAPLFLRGINEGRLAYRMVSNGRGSQLTEQDWKQYHQLLQNQADLLAKSWKIEPTDTRAATRMISVTLDQGNETGDRATMELWFHRAVDPNPDNIRAYRLKLRYLFNRDEDHHKEYIAFARECLKTGNYRAALPSLLVEAHMRLADASGDSAEYFFRPEVWQDIRMLYENSLLNFPGDISMRCGYARFAARCGHWEVVQRQCEIIGDHPAMEVFQSIESYNYLRKKAARMTTAAPGQ